MAVDKSDVSMKRSSELLTAQGAKSFNEQELVNAMRQTGLALLDERNVAAFKEIASAVALSSLLLKQPKAASSSGRIKVEDAHQDLGYIIAGAAIGAAIGGFFGGEGGAAAGAMLGAIAGAGYSQSHPEPPHREE